MPNFESPIEDLPGSRVQQTTSFFESLESRSPTAPPAREGLPASYRMRADPHYVDLLSARTSTTRDEEAARSTDAGALVRSPATSPGGDYESALAAGSDLTRSLTTLGACADLLASAHSDLSRTVVSNLIRAEVWRASTLLWATRLLRQELPVVKTAASALRILDRVDNGFLPERGLRAIGFDLRSDVPYGSVLAADESLLVGAISCAVCATLPLLETARDARLSIGATIGSVGHFTFTVWQETVAPPDGWSARAFDLHWMDRPGGTPAALSMLAFDLAAIAHGGATSVGVTTRGTRIAMSIPSGL